MEDAEALHAFVGERLDVEAIQEDNIYRGFRGSQYLLTFGREVTLGLELHQSVLNEGEPSLDKPLRAPAHFQQFPLKWFGLHAQLVGIFPFHRGRILNELCCPAPRDWTDASECAAIRDWAPFERPEVRAH